MYLRSKQPIRQFKLQSNITQIVAHNFHFAQSMFEPFPALLGFVTVTDSYACRSGCSGRRRVDC